MSCRTCKYAQVARVPTDTTGVYETVYFCTMMKNQVNSHVNGDDICDRYQDKYAEEVSNYDPVSRPDHYAAGRKYEPKDVIRDWDLNFNLGSAVKYISRAGRKDDMIQDLKKAQQFIQFEIDFLEKKVGEN